MTTWASIASNELLTRQDIEDNINNGTFARKSFFDLSGLNYAKTITKNDVDAYIFFTPNSTYYSKTGLQEIAKRDITTGSAPAPDRYFLTLFVNCAATGTTTTANLGGGVNAPLVNQFVTISGNSGCWKVTAIDQSTSVSSTINGAYGSDCACGYVVPNRYFLTRYSSCTATSDTTTANLASGLSVPAVNTFVNITGLSGCWKITSIDQSTSVSYTITNTYGNDCACSQPSISSTYSFNTFFTCQGVPSAAQSMTVSGVNLTNSIVITGDAALQFSLTGNNDYTSSVSIAPTSGTVSPRLVYVRLNGTPVNSIGLNISITSVGANSITAQTTNAFTYALPTVTGVTNGSRQGTGTVNLSATVSANATADWYAQSSGGTALATGTLTFTTPSISQTTIYYVQARDTSGAGCQNLNRTAVTATINAVTNPVPINGGLVFWGRIQQISETVSQWEELSNINYNSPIAFPYGTGLPAANYQTFNGSNTNGYVEWKPDLSNAPSNTSKSYTLMWYGTLPQGNGQNNSSNYYKLWCKDSNTNGWDIIWEPVPARFTFRSQGSLPDQHLSYNWIDSGFKLYSITITENLTYGTYITLNVCWSSLVYTISTTPSAGSATILKIAEYAVSLSILFNDSKGKGRYSISFCCASNSENSFWNSTNFGFCSCTPSSSVSINGIIANCPSAFLSPNFSINSLRNLSTSFFSVLNLADNFSNQYLSPKQSFSLRKPSMITSPVDGFDKPFNSASSVRISPNDNVNFSISIVRF